MSYIEADKNTEQRTVIQMYRLQHAQANKSCNYNDDFYRAEKTSDLRLQYYATLDYFKPSLRLFHLYHVRSKLQIRCKYIRCSLTRTFRFNYRSIPIFYYVHLLLYSKTRVPTLCGSSIHSEYLERYFRLCSILGTFDWSIKLAKTGCATLIADISNPDATTMSKNIRLHFIKEPNSCYLLSVSFTGS
jgi:hypothetical protein